MIVTSGNALSLDQIIKLTGEDAIIQLDKYKCKIMNYSPDQKIEVIDIVDYDNKKWGIRKLQTTRREYKYLAFIIKEN